MGYGKPLEEVKRHSGVEQLTDEERRSREAKEEKVIRDAAPANPEPNTVVTANQKGRNRNDKSKGSKKVEDNRPEEEKAKPVETNVPVQEGVQDEGDENRSPEQQNTESRTPAVGDIPAETVSDEDVANAPTEHEDGTTTPPVGDDNHDSSGTADAPVVPESPTDKPEDQE